MASNMSVWRAAGGNLHDILREEEAKAAAARAVQPASTDVKTAAPGANRASGWARVAASPTASTGTYITGPFCFASIPQPSSPSMSCVLLHYMISQAHLRSFPKECKDVLRSRVQYGECVGYTARVCVFITCVCGGL